jgi:hypothetical protein
MYERDLHQRRALNFDQNKSEDNGSTDLLEIIRVDVKAMQPDSDVFSNDQPVEIQVHYNAYQPIGKSQVSVFIKRSDGLTCCMMRTKLDEFDLVLERGRGVVSLYLEPLQLITGSYFVEAWFLNESDSMGIVPRAGRSDWFSVKGSALSSTDNSGVFEPNTRWSHHSEVYEPDANVALE